MRSRGQEEQETRGEGDRRSTKPRKDTVTISEEETHNIDRNIVVFLLNHTNSTGSLL